MLRTPLVKWLEHNGACHDSVTKFQGMTGRAAFFEVANHSERMWLIERFWSPLNLIPHANGDVLPATKYENAFGTKGTLTALCDRNGYCDTCIWKAVDAVPGLADALTAWFVDTDARTVYHAIGADATLTFLDIYTRDHFLQGTMRDTFIQCESLVSIEEYERMQKRKWAQEDEQADEATVAKVTEDQHVG